MRTSTQASNAVTLNAKSARGEKAIKITLYLGWGWVELGVEWVWCGSLWLYVTVSLGSSIVGDTLQELTFEPLNCGAILRGGAPQGPGR